MVVAARTLSAGSALAAADLTTRGYPVGLAPSGAEGDPAGFVGRVVAGPVWPGEVLTTGRLVDATLLAGLPTGTVALPVRATPESTGLVQPGRRVDGFVPGRAGPVVRDVLVLAVSGVGAGTAGQEDPAARVVLAVTPAEGSALFAGLDPAGTGTALTLAVH